MISTNEHLTEEEGRELNFLMKIRPLLCKDCKKIINQEISEIVFKD